MLHPVCVDVGVGYMAFDITEFGANYWLLTRRYQQGSGIVSANMGLEFSSANHSLGFSSGQIPQPGSLFVTQVNGVRWLRQPLRPKRPLASFQLLMQ